MHRSGTSCLTGVLQERGLELGDVYTQAPHNKKGNRENAEIMALNEAILMQNSCTWNAPKDIKIWTEEQKQKRSLIINNIKGNANAFWGFKDPRTVFTLPFWLEEIEDVSYIGTYRHPLKVAQSLLKRNGMPIDDGVELWYRYNYRVYNLLVNNSSPLVNFDLDDSSYIKDINSKIKSLGLELNNKASIFFDSALRNQPDIGMYKLPNKVEELYLNFKNYHAQY